MAIGPDGQSAIHHRAADPTLSVALIRAEAWKRQLLTGQATTLNQIAEAEGMTAAYAARTIRTAFLAPDLKAAILDGCLPAGLTLEAVTRHEMPLDWEAQPSLRRGLKFRRGIPDRGISLPVPLEVFPVSPGEIPCCR
ncbi:hypothetical protein [Brevundimonas sp.]|uniref:hypothetical protein n=1 Tax=Brevundimonas sp. TaxID=1871086 RepID=UPI0035B39A73